MPCGEQFRTPVRSSSISRDGQFWRRMPSASDQEAPWFPLSMAKKKKAKKKTLKKRQESSAPAHVLDQLYVLIDSHKSADPDTSTASAWCWSRTQAASLVTCSRDLERAPTCAERMGHGPYETATEGLTLLAGRLPPNGYSPPYAQGPSCCYPDFRPCRERPNP